MRRNSSANLRASILSLLLPCFSRAFLRGSHTSTSVTCGFSRSYSHAAQVPSSKVTCKSPRRPWMNCITVFAFVSITLSITILPSAFLTAIEIEHGSAVRSEEHTSEVQSHSDSVCRLLLEKKKTHISD